MIKICLTLIFGTVPFLISAQIANDLPRVIPQPVSMVRHAGLYILPRTAEVQVKTDQPGAAEIARMFVDRISPATGYTVRIKKVKAFTAPAITFVLDSAALKTLKTEGYRLDVAEKYIHLTAATSAGLFYGMQTLMQLFPPDIESQQKVVRSSWSLPLVQITDYPRFAWRGLMLDEARHFFPKDQVKHFIDDMVKYKFNLLHLHLTDDDGWRIEIRSLPKLTSVGAWRADKKGFYGFFSPPTPDEPRTYGGFLSQEDIKELVQYAAKRFVNIMPEIDVPGHSLAAIAAYSELASVPGNYTPCAGEKIMEWPKDGHFYALVDNSLCPAKPGVYEFLDKVFTEVAALFPFEYIHAGGDENAKNFWEKSELVKTLMKEEKLTTMNEVQNYFTSRVEKIIASKGKKMIGWDEIMEGKLDPQTAVMSWQKEKGGLEAAALKHKVVFSPKSYAYLNYMQGDPALEPPVHSTKLLKDVYGAEPLPKGIDSQYVNGIQGNLWTEQVYTYRTLQYMIWPRAFALAELSWTPAGRKNWPEFISRVEDHFTRYDFSKTKYCPSIYDPLFTIKSARDSTLHLTMDTQVSGLDLRFSFDNSFPDNSYEKYTGPLTIPKEASVLRVISYRNKKPIGRMISVPVADLKKRVLQETDNLSVK